MQIFYTLFLIFHIHGGKLLNIPIAFGLSAGDCVGYSQEVVKRDPRIEAECRPAIGFRI